MRKGRSSWPWVSDFCDGPVAFLTYSGASGRRPVGAHRRACAVVTPFRWDVRRYFVRQPPAEGARPAAIPPPSARAARVSGSGQRVRAVRRPPNGSVGGHGRRWTRTDIARNTPRPNFCEHAARPATVLPGIVLTAHEHRLVSRHRLRNDRRQRRLYRFSARCDPANIRRLQRFSEN